MTQLGSGPISGLVTGYPKLAGQMGLVPESAMFRTFAALNARNLLYLQAELVSLENALLQCDAENANDEKRSQYALDWFWLHQSQWDEESSKQFDLTQQIKGKLKEYNEAFIQASLLAGMPKTNKWDREYIQSFFMTREEDLIASTPLTGDDSTIWGTTKNPNGYAADLVSLRSRQSEDAFSNWIAKNAVKNLFRWGCARFKTTSKVHGVVGIYDTSIYRVTSWFTSLVASLIPIASIVALYMVDSMKARLGIIAAFNMLISTCLGTFTNAKRSEVFAVTAAFAAVQVVFVGTNNTMCSNTTIG